MADIDRVLPVVTPETAFFWQGGSDGRLRIRRCRACGHYQHPPSPVCAVCLSGDVEPEAVSGLARVATFTVNHQPWRLGLEVPFVVAIVELAEQAGLRLTTNIVRCPIDAVRIGLPVRVVFDQHDDVWLPLFEPVDLGDGASPS